MREERQQPRVEGGQLVAGEPAEHFVVGQNDASGGDSQGQQAADQHGKPEHRTLKPRLTEEAIRHGQVSVGQRRGRCRRDGFVDAFRQAGSGKDKARIQQQQFGTCIP
ncbi:MAG: hypothetical protein FJ405_05735 [Verrucomicrobia bacterium]|nr:hypothetical protein [Verrucomicrobiota bacterium]